MALQVADVRLPLAVEVNAKWYVTTETHKTGGFNSRESRNAKRRPRVEAAIRVGPEYADYIRDLQYSQIGDRYAFTMRDWQDYWVGDEPGAHHPPQEIVEDIDGNFPLIITYGPGTRKHVRRILLPDPDTFTLYIDDVPQSGGFTLGTGDDIGKVMGLSAGSGTTVTWSGLFFFPGRLDEDTIEIELIGAQNDGPPIRFVSARVVEVLEPIET